MKMIYVSCLTLTPDRDSHWIRAFETLGYEVIRYSSYYKPENKFDIFGRVYRRFNFGPGIYKIENDLISLCEEIRPDWVHFRLPIVFGYKTLKKLKKLNVKISSYFNDDPFSPNRVFGLSLKFIKAIPYYDVHFVYRQRNILEFYKAGAKRVYHCPPTYDPFRHNSHINKFDSKWKDISPDVVFIGHYENDCRLDYLERLAQEGFRVYVFGSGWNSAQKNKSLIGSNGLIVPVFGEEYNAIYRNAKVALCFFSKLNRDNWTERPLEIVAMGGLLVCERTNEALEYFVDSKEALYFSNFDELLSIVKLVVYDDLLNTRIRTLGHQKLLSMKNDVISRAKFIIDCLDQL
jgi:hypothetical protein